eukprot:TRINITY_DN6698_c0_g1_i2.p1 TRINITY_DN6698_c0_g1~~TRINITY_DN6698_c0_g1_i2.p1  ORF type:complete len:133 (-),score=29.98 TRINITY_DN6698_c0_g1_i2:90-488(-)
MGIARNQRLSLKEMQFIELMLNEIWKTLMEIFSVCEDAGRYVDAERYFDEDAGTGLVAGEPYAERNLVHVEGNLAAKQPFRKSYAEVWKYDWPIGTPSKSISLAIALEEGGNRKQQRSKPSKKPRKPRKNRH